MSYLVLARKWRPQTFDQIRGQEHIVRALRNAIAGNRIAHAYIFTGTRGVGKTSAARIFAKALNCETGPTATPCNKCSSCLEIAEGKHPDVLEIDGASNNSVEDVRRLREVVRYAPSRGKYRIYIIDEVHMLSGGAFNALLKTLEEPPPHVVFLFATTDPHKVPVTILSRCQEFDFKKLSTRELSALLSDIASSESIEIDEKSLRAVAREAEGSVRDSQSLLDQVISYAGQKVEYKDVMDVLGVVDRDLIISVARAVAFNDPEGVLERLSAAEKFGFDVKRFALDLQDFFRDLAVLKVARDPEGLVELTGEEIGEAADIISKLGWEEVHALFDMISVGVERLRQASRPGVVLEMTLLKMANMPPLIPLADLPRRALELSKKTSPELLQRAARPMQRLAEGQSAAPPEPLAAQETAKIADEGPKEPASPAPVNVRDEYDAARSPQEFWAAIVQNVGPVASAILHDHAKLVHWDVERRFLAIEVEADHKISAEGKEEEVKKAASDLAGGPVQLSIRVTAGSESTAERERRETDLARKHRQEAVTSPIVLKAQSFLGAEVGEVKLLNK